MISLQGSLRTCKVNTGYANRMNSERLQNSDVMVCPVWNGHDLAGRPVCADSYATKIPGCNVASDRVVVENAHRPVYSEYIQLNTKGLEGPKYGSEKFQVSNSRAANKATEHFKDLTGSFGMGPNKSQIGEPTCNNNYQHSRNVKERMIGNKVCANGTLASTHPGYKCPEDVAAAPAAPAPPKEHYQMGRENYIENMEQQASKQASNEVNNMQQVTNNAVEKMRQQMKEKMFNMKQRSNAVKERMQNTMNGLRK